ncbi:MAG: ribosome silencing factor [Betaproteobacteria bacterium]|jgi:ribosome-associated protein|nr:ribosome silencing factor [Betaproteobacteria bacterium]
MTSTTAALKDIRKLQRAIVDGLEDVKAQDIRVFNTEHLSPLFERVIVASGTSNRQTKALAASVRDAVREAGFDKPRVEGEENGEWIIVDCGQAVAHIMQPAIRQYYHLEEIWGEKPVRLRPGSPAPMQKPSVKPVAQPSTRATPKASAKPAPKARAAAGAAVKKTAAGKAATTAGTRKAAAKKSPAKTSAASRPRTKA